MKIVFNTYNPRSRVFDKPLKFDPESTLTAHKPWRFYMIGVQHPIYLILYVRVILPILQQIYQKPLDMH